MRGLLLTATLLLGALSVWAGEGFVCVGYPAVEPNRHAEGVAAKVAVTSTEGTRNAIVLFAKFRAELPGETLAPSWAQGIFDPDQPGSFSHFYDTMSFGKLRVRGEVAPRRFESEHQAAVYLSKDPTEPGHFDRFNLEILRQADAEIDFARFDNDGPDGIPNSGDDDGRVDVVFIATESTPPYFLSRRATGIGSLGLEEDFVTRAVGAGGGFIRIPADHGTIQRGRTFADAVGPMCHEYGHLLGLPDLYNTAFIREKGAGPEEDSAGIGNWGLIGWGASGWHGDDGPNSLCAWSRMQLGWAGVTQVSQLHEEMDPPEIGRAGDLYQIPLARREFFLLEYRRATSTYYDRHVPAEGLLIWHVDDRQVDLECADGNWLDKGYPLGQQSDSRQGGDNLDFWAHDQDYAGLHAGNLGDATDPFDGVRFHAFTSATNPDSYTSDGERGVRIEEIRLDGPVASAAVQPIPARVEFFLEPWLRDQSGERILTFEEEAVIGFSITNTGGLTATGARAVLSTEDPLIEILRPSVAFGDVGIGSYTAELLSGEAFPRFRLAGQVEGERESRLTLDLYLNDTWQERRGIITKAVATYHLSGRIVDEEGRGIRGEFLAFLAGSSFARGGWKYSSRGWRGSAADGSYRLEEPPGVYGLVVLRRDNDQPAWSPWDNDRPG